MNKLTKLLSVFVIAGAIGTGVAGIVGCTKTPTETTCDHDSKLVWVDDNNGTTHHQECADHSDYKRNENTPHRYDNDQDTTCNDCGYVRTVTPPVTDDKLEVAADVRALIVEGYGDAEVQLSPTKTSHSIDKSAIKVYFATGSSSNPVKGAEVPAANFELELRDPSLAPATEWTGLKVDGGYKIMAKLKNCKLAEGAPAALTVDMINATITVTVHNAIVEDSLVVKQGEGVKTTQVQSSTNEIVPTWTFEVTRENGEKEDVPTAEVTVSGVDTNNPTTSGVATLTWGTKAHGTQAYTITADETKVAQSFVLNFDMLTAEQKTKIKTEDVSVQDGRFVIQVTSGEVADHRGSAPNHEGKYLASRLKMGGKFDGDNAHRYVKVHVDGEATLTVYAYVNGTNTDAFLSVYDNWNYGPKDPTAPTGTQKAYVTGTAIDGRRALTEVKTNVVLTYSLPEAGDYWILSEVRDICLTYIQIDQLVDKAEGVSPIEIPTGETKLRRLSVKSETEDYKQTFTVGDTFSVNSEYTFNGIYYNNVTMAKVKEEAVTTGLTYWLGSTQLIPGETVLSADLFATLGDQSITVKVEGEDETASYTVVVESAVPGVTGITASVKDTVVTEVASADAKITLAKADIEAQLVGTNANATIEIKSVKYRLKSAAAGSETEITESVELGVGEYVILVTATVTDATANKSADFDANCELRVAVAGAIQDVKYTISADDVTAVGSANSTEEKTLLDNANGKIVVGTNCKGGSNKVTVDGTEYSNRIQLGGTYKAADGSKNAIVLTVKEPCKIKVIYNTSGSDARTLSLYDSEGTKTAAGKSLSAAELVEYTVAKAGTYYLGSEKSGINIWYIEIDYTSNNV